MELFSIHQPDTLGIDFGCEDWQLVWADSYTEALTLYVGHYKGECDPHATDEEFAAGCKVELKENHGQSPGKEGPHFEHRRLVERQMGFRCEGESACESCELYAMDLDEFHVCSSCNQCEECGHAEDCDELVDTALIVEKS